MLYDYCRMHRLVTDWRNHTCLRLTTHLIHVAPCFGLVVDTYLSRPLIPSITAGLNEWDGRLPGVC